jgi:hypothetical protein
VRRAARILAAERDESLSTFVAEAVLERITQLDPERAATLRRV